MMVVDRVCRGWLLVGALVGSACASDGEPAMVPAKLEAPQLRTPMSNAYVGSILAPSSLVPTFSWAPVDGAAPAVSYELQISTDATFARSLITLPTTGTSLEPALELPVSRKVPVGTRYYWRVRSCDDVTCSTYSPARTLNLGRSDHDFNGDGVADVVVGAPTYAGGALAQAYVYFGGAGATFDPDPDGTLVAEAPNDWFATAIASAGDLNNDGFADVVVGAEAARGTGAAYVYFGGPGSTFDATPDIVLRGTTSGDRFGSTVSGAGDVNGDGFADFVIGAPNGDGQQGVAYVFLGGPNAAPDLIALHGRDTGDRNARSFGLQVASLGDLDGDGYADLAVAMISSNGIPTRIYFGGREHPLVDSTSLRGNSVGPIAGANDVNGDGFADILFGEAGAGKAVLYFGAATRSAIGATLVTYAEPDPGFGASVASPGDVDGDGYADVLIGAGGHYVGSRGGVYLYFGGPQASLATFAYSTLIPAHNPSDERLVTSTGDVNGDGVADLVVGGLNDSATGFAGSVVIYAGGGRHAFDQPAYGTLIDKLTAGTGEFGRALAVRAPAQCQLTLKSRWSTSWLPTRS